MTETTHATPADAAPNEPQPVRFVPFPVAHRTELYETLNSSGASPEAVEQVMGQLASQDVLDRQGRVDEYKKRAHTEDELTESNHKLYHAENENEQLRRENRFDTLTGLFNKKHFEGQVRKYIEEGKSFSVVLMDLDGFKQLNDTKGHNAGDEILRATGKVLREQQFVSLREGDFAARLGGDEFAIFVHTGFSGNDRRFEKSGQEARKGFVNRLDHAVHSAAEMTHAGADIYMSAGAADHYEGESYEELMHRVDELMYDSKTSKKAHRELVQARDKNQLPTSAYVELDGLGEVNYRGEKWQVYNTNNLQSKIERYFIDADAIKEGRNDDAFKDPLSVETSRFIHVFERFGKDHPALWKRLERLAKQKQTHIDSVRNSESPIPIADRQANFMEWMLNTEVERKVLMTAAYGFMKRIVMQNRVSHPEETLLPIDLIK
ncbi:MAG TPA: GGDEF domain-containing protein [Candidatus Saccharibacteria bacterium]|jgi:diguanylate cyclase (GGDEF)-like protein|nr:GGDEF domain-containing protein [Candidatus Saccharibacteria bacterium]HMT55572.1 GGDEF domain-containing protein [Candidatus Saccharibacteria bacterium]